MKISKYFYADIILALTFLSKLFIADVYYKFVFLTVTIAYVTLVIYELLVIKKFSFSIPKFPGIINEFLVLVVLFLFLSDLTQISSLWILIFTVVFVFKFFFNEKKV
jgi:hypothetical protein